MLTKLSERWQQTGLWEQITTKKVIVTEPRFTDEFESAMRHFYEVIKFLGYDYSFRLYKRRTRRSNRRQIQIRYVKFINNSR